MIAVFEREFKSYFRGIIGYLFCAFLLLFAGIFTMSYNLNSGYANFEYVMKSMSLIFIFAIPVLTMGTIAEERRKKTDQLLLTLPVGLPKIVLGKYFALLCVFDVPIAVMALYPLILSRYGNVFFLAAYGPLLACFFMGAALIAIGMFISSLTDNQVVAAVLCLVVFLINNYMVSLAYYVPGTAAGSFFAFSGLVLLLCIVTRIMTKNWAAAFSILAAVEAIIFCLKIFWPGVLEGAFPIFMSSISIFDRFNLFVEGMFDLTTLFFYVIVAVVFLFFTVQSLDKRRWN